jgi:hypothetical protein
MEQMDEKTFKSGGRTERQINDAIRVRRIFRRDGYDKEHHRYFWAMNGGEWESIPWSLYRELTYHHTMERKKREEQCQKNKLENEKES